MSTSRITSAPRQFINIERIVKRIIMEYKTLGNTGLLVSRLSLGTMTFGGGEGLSKVIGGVDQKGADELIKASHRRWHQLLRYRRRLLGG